MNKDSQNIKYLLALASQHYGAGDVASSAKVYGQILSQDPHNAEAILMMAVLAYKTQRYDVAEKFALGGIELKSPLVFIGHKILGDVCRVRENWDGAIAAYKKAIALNPESIESLNNLASIYLMQNKLDDADFYYKKVLKINPSYATALSNMGTISEARERYDEAENFYKKSLQANPNFAPAHFGLGSLSYKRHDYNLARNYFLAALKINPRHVESLTSLGDLEKETGQYEEALHYYEKAVAISPRADILTMIGLVNERLNKYHDAMKCYESALSIDPAFVRALRNLVRIYAHFELHERTYEISQRGLDIEPEDVAFLSAMGHALRGMGRTREAIDFYRRAVSLRPDDETLYPSFILAMMFEGTIPPEDVANVTFEFGKNVALPLLRDRPHKNDKNPDRRLKIGYVSPDFRDHSVNYFFEHILTGHDRQQFEIHAFSNVQLKDAVTERLQLQFDVWHDIKPLNDDAAADLVEEKGIDILVDLAGHTADNRLLVFARKPAPVQVTWLGYPATTGIGAIDYRLTDVFTDPVGMTEHLNAEKLWRLPHIFCCYSASKKDIPVIDHPPSVNNGYVTFGCFNNYNKVSDIALAAWGRIMARVPDSRLMLEIKGLETDKFRSGVLDRLESHGIPPARVILEQHRRKNQYVLYNKIDIALDPFPGCGGTTSMDTMWMGVPMISLAGTFFASRIGVSVLNNAGLPDLVATDVDEYVAKASDLALSPDRLATLRAGMRSRVEASPMMDKKLFIRDMEDAYRAMWRKWCADH